MNFGQILINYIENRRIKKQRLQSGPIGQFWRRGGYQLIYDVPVSTGSLVIDAGGYHGDWSAEVVSRYGCRVLIFEPVPEFAELCRFRFKKNQLIKVVSAALGSSKRTTVFNFFGNGTSEFQIRKNVRQVEVDVVDVLQVIDELDGERVACLKLNIEGGEYDVLERMIAMNKISQCDSLLIQFHSKPEGYALRYKNLVKELNKTHTQSWCYELVWEMWMNRSLNTEC